MRKYLALASAVAIAIGLNMTYNAGPSNELLYEYILQGAKKSTILEDVKSVGGVVVREHLVIDAISVKLSDIQLAEIKKLNPMLRSFKDQSIKVASAVQSFSSNNISFDLKEKTATWKGVNSSYSSVLIDEISLNMPKANKKIRSLTINGEKLKTKALKLNETIKLSSKDAIELGAGQVVTVEIEFDKLKDTNTGNYQVSFGESFDEPLRDYSSSSALAYASAGEMMSKEGLIDNDGDIAGKLKFYLRDNQAKWTISNVLYYPQTLAQLELKYPKDNDAISQILVNNVAVDFSENKDKITFKDPILVAAQTVIDIKVTFEKLESIYSEEYELRVSFENGLTKNIIVPLKSYEQGRDRDTNYPTLVRANLAHQIGLTGHGVTVAILDTGARDLTEIKETATAGKRDITIIDVLGETQAKKLLKDSDRNGHGTHLVSIIANSSPSIDANGEETGGYNGIAPDVNLVVVKAFDEEGQSSYLDILAALEYVVENKDVLNIKVLNLSFSALPSSYYWDDPLNQALMKAWQAGITVVAAAGNRGPEAMTIGVPGNTPYVITVGAVSDNYTPDNRNDDFVTTFSSAGPTYEGFVKPEIVAPGGHIQGVMDKSTLIRETFPLYNDKKGKDAHDYFEMSGSSQSTAVTSGIVALMLQANPDLSPDDIKCRLMATANAAATETGELAFSVFQQGAGLVDAMAAIESTEVGCGNEGLSIAKDLSGEEHFIGPARRHAEDGNFYIEGVDGLEWSGAYTDSQLWRNMSLGTDSQLWRNLSFNADSQLWRHTNFISNSQLWRTMSFSAESQLWRDMSFNAESQLWRDMSFNAESQLWRDMSFSAESQLWRNMSFDAESQLWRNMSFDAESQLWRNMSFSSDSLSREWVDHE